MIPLHTFTYAAQHWPGLLTGDIVRFGAILKDAHTGRIVGHLQETGVFQTLLSSGTSIPFSPINGIFGALTGVVGVAQNMQMARTLTAIQQTLGVVQALGAATLVSSVVGLGATVVGTAVLMRRIDGVAAHVGQISEKIETLPQIMRDERLTDTFDQVRHALQRLAEIDARPEMGRSVAESEEQRLDECFRILVRGVRQTESLVSIDPGLLRLLLAGMMLSSDAVATVRLRFDGPKAAMIGAQRHYEEFEIALRNMPPDWLRQRIAVPQDEKATVTLALSLDIRELRARMASRSVFHEMLDQSAVVGSEFLARTAEVEGEPLLFIPNLAR